ncbi:BnaA09g38830D [Brassica napus]|uniref:(rape) hypothetical protein n=1 Tax=Brassica napus TaxID=3708 RepID=A0A078ISA1_BRANA|nr:unnamed protein product [Brassica napus]CDY52334.1 BnaA09g38830D [Brassica napus]
MDMISQLSDDLLIRILSLVRTKHVMATCCLSKRWLLLWSLVPKLDYDDSSYSDENYATFTQFVYRSLMSNKAPVLESLSLTLGPKCQAVDVGRWIETAVCHRVHALILNYTLPYEEETMLSLPSSIYTCETLETLKLSGCFSLDDIPFSVCLPSLKTLEIINVEVSSLTRLLSGCPNLDSLVVDQEDIDVDIVVPSLRKLNMVNYTGGQKGSGFVIDARSLVALYIKDDVFNDYHRIEYMPKLEKAYVDITCGVRDHKFLKAFTCARKLSLCLSFLEVLSPRSMIFHNLVYLTLNTCVLGWWDLVTHMLQDSPKLRFLKLHDEHDLLLTSIEPPDCWKPPSSVPKCLLHTFEAFEWYGYKGRRGDVVMATYLIEHATWLKEATFFSEESDDKRDRMLEDFTSVAAPSPCFTFYWSWSSDQGMTYSGYLLRKNKLLGWCYWV